MKNFLEAIVFTFGISLYSHATAGEWKAGLATIKITPETPVPMAGYASRVKPYERVEQDIYAKALALASEGIKKFFNGNQPKKVIYVAQRGMINSSSSTHRISKTSSRVRG